MRLFLIFGIICLCVIVACFVVYATIGLPKPIQPIPPENSVTYQGTTNAYHPI